MDAEVPTDVRRRILEASVRAPQDWHQDAVRAAYASGDGAWSLTAVFCMRFVRGFDEQIVETDAYSPIRTEAKSPLLRLVDEQPLLADGAEREQSVGDSLTSAEPSNSQEENPGREGESNEELL